MFHSLLRSLPGATRTGGITIKGGRSSIQCLSELFGQRFYSINGNQIRSGMVLIIDGKLLQVEKTQHVKPGKGGAFMQVNLRDIKQGTKTAARFRAAESVEQAKFGPKQEYQYLYTEGQKVILMHPETFEQVEMSTSVLGDRLPFLEEGMTVSVQSYQEEILNCVLPQTVTCTVEETEDARSGTNNSSPKPATLHNGVQIKVPQYIATGDAIVVRPEDLEFVSRADSFSTSKA